MTSSTHKKQQLIPNMYGATSAPPPTPSAYQPSKSTDPSDFLSRLIHRLPPTLSIPPRRQASANVPLPTIAFSDANTANPSFLEEVLLRCTASGFFQMVCHPVPRELALLAEPEMVSIFDQSPEKKRSCFPRNWPLGYGNDDEDEESDETGEFFLLDEDCVSHAESESTELGLTSLCELSRSLEKVGSEVIGWLFDAIGVENPVEKGQTTLVRSLAWVSKDSVAGSSCSSITGMSDSGRCYPFVVGLRYQVRSRKYTLISDSAPVVVAPQVDSILVTIGDIAQVWSNGRLKKVRGRPIPCSDADEGNNDTTSFADDVGLTLLMTLPTETTVSPLPRKTIADGDSRSKDDREAFDSFSFEDYAWRVYHDRGISPKDPLDRYRCRG